MALHVFDVTSAAYAAQPCPVIHRELRHENIVTYIGTQVEDEVVYIFTDWVSGGSLHDIIKKFGSMNEELVRRYARQILRGLVHLHDYNVAHRDIKPGNLLVGSSGIVKLADFGASRRLGPGVLSLRRRKVW